MFGLTCCLIIKMSVYYACVYSDMGQLRNSLNLVHSHWQFEGHVTYSINDKLYFQAHHKAQLSSSPSKTNKFSFIARKSLCVNTSFCNVPNECSWWIFIQKDPIDFLLFHVFNLESNHIQRTSAIH